LSAGQQIEAVNFQQGQGSVGNGKVTKVDRIKHPAHQADIRHDGGICHLFANMPVTQHDILLRGQAFQADRATGVNLVGGNTDLRTETVFKAVGKAR